MRQNRVKFPPCEPLVSQVPLLPVICLLQVDSLKQQHEIREREFESRLRNVEEMNRRSVNELREMLTAQQKLGAQ